MKVVSILFLFFCYLNSYAQSFVVQKNEFSLASNKISHYLGKTGEWNPEVLISQLSKFELVTTDLVGMLPSNKVDWIYFELSNPDGIDLWTNLGSDRLSRIKVFKLDSNKKVIDTYESGVDYGTDFRPVGEYSFWLPLLNSDEPKGTFLIGFYSNVQNHEFRPIFGSKDMIFEATKFDQIYTMIYTGIMLIMIFYNFILSATLRDKIYVFYSLNLIVVYFATTYGVHFPTISIFIGEAAAHNYMPLWLSSVFIFMSLFTSVYFNLPKTAPLWNKIMWGVTITSIINGLLIFILPAYIFATGFIILLVALYAVCTLIGIDQIKKKHPLSKLYVLAWVIVFLCVTVYFMVTQLGMFYNDLFYYANYISSSLEAAIFSVALGYRYRLIMQKEKRTAKLLESKNEALMLTNSSLDSFNYHVSHDLKSVLVNTGSLNKMISKYAKKDKVDKVISISDKLEEVVEKGQETITGFLALGKSLNQTEVSLEKVKLMDEIQRITIDNGLEVSVKFDHYDFEYLTMNKVAFESIFLNLLTNSIKYCTLKPAVNIELRKKARELQIIYSDNGIGVDLNQFEDDLFSPFKRVENDLKKEGSGIGLYLVKRIITNYYGTITPSSEPNKGLQYLITFPVDMLDKD